MSLDSGLSGGAALAEPLPQAGGSGNAGRLGLRPATQGDLIHLQRALALAAFWRDSSPEVGRLHGDPKVMAYVAGWQRPGDAGHLAIIDGEVVGAAWYRHFTGAEHGFGYLAPEIPELTIGVEPEHRNKGIGRALLHTLFAQARLEGIDSVSLSVEEDNPAIALYRDLGFTAVARDRNALTMRRRLRRGA